MLKAKSLLAARPGAITFLGIAGTFGLFLLAVGANPAEVYKGMIDSTVGSAYGAGEVAIRCAPYILAALATAIPARAGLVNVGGEGQLVVGALTASAAAVALGDAAGIFTLPLLVLFGAFGGAAWSGMAGWLRVRFGLNEIISTLLFNYVSALFVRFILHGPLRDPESFNWPFSPPFLDVSRWPTIPGTRVHLGIALALLIPPLLWFLVARTRWGFHLRVVGGNPEAARRAGISVDRTLLTAMLIGGAAAGIAGMIEVTGVEGRMRPTTGVGFGYVGFLASWMANHHPLWVIGSASLLAVIAVSGDDLQLTAGLPASTVNILTALVLIGFLGRFGRSRA